MRLLDLFCGAGGCSVGYHRAGFDVVGVDLNHRPLRHYPYESHQADALAVLDGSGPVDPDSFQVIHASPPCQAYSITKHTHSVEYPDLLQPTLDRLEAWAERTGGVWVVENVPGAPMPGAITVCGAHLRAWDELSGQTLRLRRHRLFLSNVPLMAHPCGCDTTPIGGNYGAGSVTPEKARIRRGGYTPPGDVRRALMGVDWMPLDALAEAIPPDYTHQIGEQLRAYL